MQIGIDGGCWSNRRGYGRFLRELLESVARFDSENQYMVFLDHSAYREFGLGEPFQPVLVETSAGVAEAAHAEGRRSVTDLLRMGRAVARERLDVFFFPSVYSYFPLLRSVPTVLGIHDTIADRNPKFAFTSKRHALFWNWKVKLAIRQADTVLTVSEYSRSCLERHFGIPRNRIRVLYEAASARFRKTAAASGTSRYVLYVGGISPNKNLDTLIRAFALTQARCGGVKLILVGDYKSDGFKGCYADLKELVDAAGLGSSVIFAGFVPDEDLCELYNGASVFVMPSLDEGFGLPALEAMACGSPVVVSAGHALEEIAGSAGIVVDPRDEGAIADAIDRVLFDAEFAEEMSRRSERRAAQFSWERAGLELVQILEETARGRRAVAV